MGKKIIEDIIQSDWTKMSNLNSLLEMGSPILKNSPMKVMYFLKRKTTKYRYDYVQTVGDNVQTVGDNVQTVGDNVQSVGGFKEGLW